MKRTIAGYLLTVSVALGLTMLVMAQDLRHTPSGDILLSSYGDRNGTTVTNVLSRLGTSRQVRVIFDAGVWIFSNDVNFTTNVTVEIREGAKWNVLTNNTIDIQGDFFAPFELIWFGDGVVTGDAAFLWNKREWGPQFPFGNKDPGEGRINVAFQNTTNWALTSFVGRVSGDLVINISTNDNVADIINLMTNIGFVDIGGKLTFQWEDGNHFYAKPLDFFGNIGGAGQVCLLGNTNDPTQVKVNFTNNTTGFEVMDNGTINLLDGFEVIGTDTGGIDAGVFSRNSSSLNVGSNMIVHDFHFGFAASQGGELLCNGGSVFDCFIGVIGALNGTVVADSMFIGTNAIGVQGGGSSFVRVTGSTITNNTLGLTAVFNGFIRADDTITNGNTTAAFPVTNKVGNTQGFISRLP